VESSSGVAGVNANGRVDSFPVYLKNRLKTGCMGHVGDDIRESKKYFAVLTVLQDLSCASFSTKIGNIRF
jgi:hypothetical protein